MPKSGYRQILMLGSKYKLNYHGVKVDDDLNEMYFDSDNEIDKIIRIIFICNKQKYNKEELLLGVISVDLSDFKDDKGNSIYKMLFEKLNEENKDELCNI